MDSFIHLLHCCTLLLSVKEGRKEGRKEGMVFLAICFALVRMKWAGNNLWLITNEMKFWMNHTTDEGSVARPAIVPYVPRVNIQCLLRYWQLLPSSFAVVWDVWWLGGVVVKALATQLWWRGFESHPGRSRDLKKSLPSHCVWMCQSVHEKPVSAPKWLQCDCRWVWMNKLYICFSWLKNM